MITKWPFLPRNKRAQHKRPGASAQRDRRETALARLLDRPSVPNALQTQQIATLRHRLGVSG